MSDLPLEPVFNYETYELEDKNKYLDRTLRLLPNFPKDVITQWFYDHPQQVHDHEWLEYKKLKFELITLGTDQIPVTDLGNTGAVEAYRYNYFVIGNTSSRREKLESYFQEHGTWPVPPIFLKNKDGNLKYPFGFPCGKPLHLLEGHNRMAFFIEYKSLNKISNSHLVYITEKI
ncbi:MAG TPA: hypothetical protein DDY17_08140 [Syntrophaceae bacterium]|jgi:hypothetical protein|nr:hypothetical protein [Syntrophaceae bacterium]